MEVLFLSWHVVKNETRDATNKVDSLQGRLLVETVVTGGKFQNARLKFRLYVYYSPVVQQNILF